MDKIEQRIIEIIDQNAQRLIDFGTDIYEHPELGYMEHRTAGKFAEQLRSLGLEPQEGLAVTGVKSYLKKPEEGELRLCLMGELDALCVPGHPFADPVTTAAHCCGHNAQLTGVLGAAIALTDPEVKAALGGNVVFIGVPNEEAGTPDDVLAQLRAEGKVTHVGGKCEFIEIGAVDDIDLTVGHHTAAGEAHISQVRNAPSMGMVRKFVTFKGKSSHPTRAAHAIDCQKTAALTLNNVNAQREALEWLWQPSRFMLHSQVMTGASAINVVSRECQMVFDIRAQAQPMINELCYMADRAVEGAAIVTGAGYESRIEPGYLPVVPVTDESAQVMIDTFKLVDPDTPVDYQGPKDFSGTTDYGDLSSVMPVMMFQTGGVGGQGHNVDWHITDPYEFYVTTAKVFAIAAYKLMKDNCAFAKKVVEQNPAQMTTQQWRDLKFEQAQLKVKEMVPTPWFGPTPDAPNPPEEQ